MSTFNSPGWRVKPKDFESFTAVTISNRKNAVVMGRILYVIDDIKCYKGYFVIRPQLVKGRLSITNHPYLPDNNIFIKEDEPFNDYKSSFDKLITLQIEKQQLFFKLTDQLIKHTYDKAKV